MGAIASQITSLAIVYSAVYSDADQRKHESSASLAFVWGIHRDRWIPRTKGQLRGKCFHLMTSSWIVLSSIFTKSRYSISSLSANQLFWNLAHDMAILLLQNVQNIITIERLRSKLWSNEISLNCCLKCYRVYFKKTICRLFVVVCEIMWYFDPRYIDSV